MSTLLEKPVRVNRTITTSMGHARAIEDPARSKILEALYHNELSAEQIAGRLEKAGHKKALTTVRHHLEILRGSGLVEVVRISETRGAITKFYGTSTKLLGYSVPDDFDDRYSKQIKSTAAKVEKILTSIAPNMPQLEQDTGRDEGYSQYLMLEIMNRAVTNVFENSAVAGGSRAGATAAAKDAAVDAKAPSGSANAGATAAAKDAAVATAAAAVDAKAPSRQARKRRSKGS